MQKVRLNVENKIIELNVSKVFRSKNPIIIQHNVNLMDANNKGIRLYCKTEEEAKRLTQKIREDKNSLSSKVESIEFICNTILFITI